MLKNFCFKWYKRVQESKYPCPLFQTLSSKATTLVVVLIPSRDNCIIYVCMEAFLHTAHLGNHSILEHVDLLHLFSMVLESILLHPFNNVPIFTKMCFKSLAVFCNMNHTAITVYINFLNSQKQNWSESNNNFTFNRFFKLSSTEVSSTNT